MRVIFMMKIQTEVKNCLWEDPLSMKMEKQTQEKKNHTHKGFPGKKELHNKSGRSMENRE